MSATGEQRLSASALASGSCSVVPLVPGRLVLLSLPYDLSQGVSTHPAGTTGYSSVNCYLLLQGSRALLIDTGFPAQLPALLSLLERALPDQTTLSLMPLRAGEVGSLGNVVPLANRYELEDLYCILPREFVYDFDVRTQAARATDRADHHHPHSELAGPEPRTINVNDDARPVDWFKPMIQLLIQTWAYDHDTHTMFTSEIFGQLTNTTPDGPWTIDDPAQDPTTVEGLVAYLRDGNRFWWLAGGDGPRIADWLEEVFAEYPVERIAPGFGRVFEGRAAVEHEVDLWRQALVQVSAEPRYTTRGA